MFHTEFLAVLMMIDTEIHSLSSNGSLVIAIKPEAKYRFLAAAMLFYKVQKNITLTKVAYFLKISYHTHHGRHIVITVRRKLEVRKWDGF
jgi:hypothetical protein